MGNRGLRQAHATRRSTDAAPRDDFVKIMQVAEVRGHGGGTAIEDRDSGAWSAIPESRLACPYSNFLYTGSNFNWRQPLAQQDNHPVVAGGEGERMSVVVMRDIQQSTCQ
jgi:hypothetical protein